MKVEKDHVGDVMRGIDKPELRGSGHYNKEGRVILNPDVNENYLVFLKYPSQV